MELKDIIIPFTISVSIVAILMYELVNFILGLVLW